MADILPCEIKYALYSSTNCNTSNSEGDKVTSVFAQLIQPLIFTACLTLYSFRGKKLCYTKEIILKQSFYLKVLEIVDMKFYELIKLV